MAMAEWRGAGELSLARGLVAIFRKIAAQLRDFSQRLY